MGNGDKSLKNFHLHIPHQWRKYSIRGGVPEGCLPIKVGREGEGEQRFVVPVMYFNHPLFLRLLKASEEEYGFDQKGTFSIPCHVEEFRFIKDVIDREILFHHHHCSSSSSTSTSSHHFSCFKSFDQKDSAFN